MAFDHTSAERQPERGERRVWYHDGPLGELLHSMCLGVALQAWLT